MKIITKTTGSNYNIDICQGVIINIVLTVTGNITISASNFDWGDVVFLTLIQDGTGSHTITINSDYTWVGGAAPTLTTAANSVDKFIFSSSGTKLEEHSRALDVK